MMSRVKIMSLLLLGLGLAAVMTIGIYAEQTADKSDVSIRKMEPQKVLYTIYRGEYEKIGKAIGNLFGMAMKNQIWPKGSISLVYLNNPQYISGEHCLVEIRIPVDQDTLKLAGTLGEMTDVKEIKAMEVAVIKKSAGQMNYDSLYNSLHTWISRNGYVTTENACEIFTTTGGMTDYSQLNSEIVIPVEKLSPAD